MAFEGEEMICWRCGRTKQHTPGKPSKWTAFSSLNDTVVIYECPRHYPGMTAKKKTELFQKAMEKVNSQSVPFGNWELKIDAPEGVIVVTGATGQKQPDSTPE